MIEPPRFPIDAFDQVAPDDPTQERALIDQLASAPMVLRDAVSGLSAAQLDLRYRNWSIRQIVHHMADSHMHSYIRFKWALTEDAPIIKAYDEGLWSEMQDARTSPIEPSLDLLQGLHLRWATVLRGMSADDYGRTFKHPETGEVVKLSLALAYYAWHSRHHTAQIEWVCANRL